MSHATFAARDGAIELTGVEVANIGHLAELALAEALSTPEAAPVCRALGWTPGAPMYALSQAKVMIGDKGPWHLFNVGCAELAGRVPGAVSLVRLYEDRYGWVEGADRGWLADHYQQCLDAGAARPLAGDRHRGPMDLGGGRILPPGTRAGWEEVIEWLRSGDEPVVTTLSIGENRFPSGSLAIVADLWQPAVPDYVDQQEETDPWDELGYAEQWDLSIRALRVLESSRPRRWTPEDFARRSLMVSDLIEFAEYVRPTESGRGQLF